MLKVVALVLRHHQCWDPRFRTRSRPANTKITNGSLCKRRRKPTHPKASAIDVTGANGNRIGAPAAARPSFHLIVSVEGAENLQGPRMQAKIYTTR